LDEVFIALFEKLPSTQNAYLEKCAANPRGNAIGWVARTGKAQAGGFI
jgi:hypothetical protein